MDINIVAGSYSEVNNQYIYSLLKNRDRNKNHIIIAPDRSLFSIEQRLFSETGEGCFFDINVLSLSRLCKSVIKNSNKKILSKQSGVALTKKILNDNCEKLSVFSGAINYSGFASSMYETICFYKSCNVAPEEIFVDKSSSFANLKQKDIKLIYEEYEKYLQNEFTDSFNQLKVFADAINENTFRNTVFYFVEFDDFTKLMYEIILKISRYSEGVYISCTYGKKNNNSNIYSHKVYYDLVDLYKSNGLEYKIIKLDDDNDKFKKHLSRNLLSYSPEKLLIDENKIQIKQFDNLNDEVQYTIADIYSQLILNNSSVSDFAIVVPSLDDYMNSIMQETKKYDINCYFDKTETLFDSNVIRLLFDICTIISGDYGRSDFSVVLKSPLLNFDKSSVCEYDNYLKRINAISDMCLCIEKIEDAEIRKFFQLIFDSRKQLKEDLVASEYLNIILNIFNYIGGRALTYLEKVDALSKRTYAQVVKKFENIIKDYMGVLGTTKVSTFVEFVEVFKEYFVSTNISMPPITSNTLFVADFNVSYLSNYKYIYILGNNDGKLPSQKLDNGIVTDDELLRLPNSAKLTPTVAMLNARKVFKLFDLCLRFRDKLYLSYLAGNLEGKLYPNNIIESLIKMGSINAENYSGVLDVVSRNFYNININNVIFNNLTRQKVKENTINYLMDWEVYNNNTNYRQISSSLFNLLDEKTKTQLLNIGSDVKLPNLTEKKLLKNHNTSISQIETFNRCPYLHFVKYGLRLKEFVDTNLRPVDIGNIIHEVLSVLVPAMILINNVEEIKDKANSVLDKVLKKDAYTEILLNKNNRYIIRALYLELSRVIDAVYSEIKNSEFLPKFCEYRFDAINVNGISLYGYIDRIDVSGNGFIILDYKTGDNQFKNYNDVVSGKKLQLLVYAKAYEDSSGLECRGAFYFPIMNGFNEGGSYRLNGVLLKSDDNIVAMDRNLVNCNHKSDTIHLQTTSKGNIKENAYYKNMCLERDDFDYLLNFVKQQVCKSVGRIIDGEINPRPLNENGKRVCEYCQYKALCNYDNLNDNIVENIPDINVIKERGN